ncbi:MAG: prepilin-type N-terminal cleavage/methylation domain-containing protein [Planctomycetota bacterium]
MRSTRPRNGRLGFTLVELVVVILILGVLAGIAVPYTFGVSEQAAEQAVVTQVQQIFEAAEIFKARNGRWPNDASSGDFPSDFDGLLPSSLFTSRTPIGAYYDWDGLGTARPVIGVGIYVGIPATRSVDELADDGDLNTGWVQRLGGALHFKLDDN